jgi:thioredoxin 1
MELTDKNFEKEVLKANIPVLVDFWASWCPPCKMVEPVLDKLEKEYAGKVKIAKINVDRNPITSSKYQIKGVPTFILFQNAKIIKREVGAKSEKQLRQMINTALKIATNP